MHGLLDGTVGRKDFLQRRASQGRVSRDGQSKRQKLVVEPFDHEKVHLLKHGQSGGMDG